MTIPQVHLGSYVSAKSYMTSQEPHWSEEMPLPEDLLPDWDFQEGQTFRSQGGCLITVLEVGDGTAVPFPLRQDMYRGVPGLWYSVNGQGRLFSTRASALQKLGKVVWYPEP